MIKISVDNKKIKETITIDPYIPIDVKWEHWDEVLENTKYCRFGDFKHSLLEIGVGSISGQIRTLTLVEVKEIDIGKSKYSLKTPICKFGVPILNAAGWIGLNKLDVNCKLSVSTFESELLIFLGDSEPVKYFQSGRIIFGVDESNILCRIIVYKLTIDEINDLNNSLRQMR
ncbi:MAG: hypothetical protein JEZ00_18960 [Anaerolineaceae bacterium]|nr:hypothetical protein [Anaerolineaceae bacterium]